MKRLILLAIILCVSVITKAQSNRWMYLFNDKGITYFVDTLSNDTKRIDDDYGHAGAIAIWAKTIQKKSNKKGSFTESTLVRYEIDTTNNQIEIKSVAVYHNDVAMPEGYYNPLWQDVVPESAGEVLVAYCKALNDPQLMDKFILNAKSHNSKTPLKKK